MAFACACRLAGPAAAHSTQPARPPAQTRRHRGRKLGRPGCEPTPPAPHRQLWKPYVHIQRTESRQHPRAFPSAQRKAGPAGLAGPSKLPSPWLPPFGTQVQSRRPSRQGPILAGRRLQIANQRGKRSMPAPWTCLRAASCRGRPFSVSPGLPLLRRAFVWSRRYVYFQNLTKSVTTVALLVRSN